MMYNIDALRKIDTDLGNALQRDRENLAELQNPSVDPVFRQGGRWDVGEGDVAKQSDKKLAEMSRDELEAFLKTLEAAERKYQKGKDTRR